jgi:hypothetical protein
MLAFDEDDLEALGFGNQYLALAATNWAAYSDEARKARDKRYRDSLGGKAARRAWVKTRRESPSAADIKYRQSDRAKELARERNRKYRASMKGKTNRKRYAQSEAGRVAKSRHNAKYYRKKHSDRLTEVTN